MTFATALREALRDGYRPADLRADLAAGVTVGVIALPLAMALAIASGVPPQHGLFTAIVAGALIALTGGSRHSVAGPTAAFVVILHPISVQFGLGGLLLATMMAGVIQMVMGLARMGRLIEFIPHPVTTGFTAGIAVVIASLQLRDFFGVTYADEPGHMFERLTAFADAIPAMAWEAVLIGAVTLVAIVLWDRYGRGLPPHLVGIVAGTGAGLALLALVSDAEVATIGSRFAEIPRNFPEPLLPWRLPGPDGHQLALSFELIEALIRPAFAIALLGAIESLLCAVVTDGLSGTRHDPNAELFGQGIGNLVVPFFGGIAATGAMARSAVNVRAGARTPLAAVIHSVFVLVAMLVFAPVLEWLPMAALAALLLWVAWNFADVRHFVGIVRRAPKSDIAVLLTCFGLTVLFDMVLAVGVGVVLAALLFMKRMSGLTQTRLVDGAAGEAAGVAVPADTRVYAVAGPLFFGAAERAVAAFGRTDPGVRRVVLNLHAVPAIDVTGLVALESAIGRLNSAGIAVALAGVQPQPMKALRKAGLDTRDGVTLHSTLADALAAPVSSSRAV